MDAGLVLHEIWLLRLRALLAAPTETRLHTATTATATARWRHRLASGGI
jgi:hypothetical protein